MFGQYAVIQHQPAAAGAADTEVRVGLHPSHARTVRRERCYVTPGQGQERGPRGFLLAGLLMSLVVFIPLVYIIASAAELGLSTGHGAAVLAVISATSAATRLGVGWLATPATLPSLYRAAHVLVAAAFGVWALTAQAAPLQAFRMLLLVAALFGAGYGGWLSLGPAVLAATCRPTRLGHALGTLASVVGIGGVTGPVLAGPCSRPPPLHCWSGARSPHSPRPPLPALHGAAAHRLGHHSRLRR